MTLLRALRPWAALVALSLSIAVVGAAGAATITIVNNNAPGVGFNDPSPRLPVGGNPGITLGDQRLNVFNYAAGIWGGVNERPSLIMASTARGFARSDCTPRPAM